MVDRREHPRQEIRLKVAYKNPQALVTEYTKSLSKGGCSIESKRPLPVGTVFVFEMFTPSSPQPVEVEGRVTYAMSVNNGEHYLLGIAYTACDEKRAELTRVIEQIFNAHRWDINRRYPRVPVNFAGVDRRQPTRQYLVRDISLGGMGLRVVGQSELPAGFAVGTPVRIGLSLASRPPVELFGLIAWVASSRPAVGEAAVGISLQDVSWGERDVLERLQRLDEVPTRVTFEFGHDAPAS